MTTDLPDWATEDQQRCGACGAFVACSSGDWIDDDGNLDGTDGHLHAPTTQGDQT